MDPKCHPKSIENLPRICTFAPGHHFGRPWYVLAPILYRFDVLWMHFWWPWMDFWWRLVSLLILSGTFCCYSVHFSNDFPGGTAACNWCNILLNLWSIPWQVWCICLIFDHVWFEGFIAYTMLCLTMFPMFPMFPKRIYDIGPKYFCCNKVVITALCSLSVRSMFALFSLYVRAMFALCSRYVRAMFALCSLNVRSMFALCSLYVRSMFALCSLYVRSMFAPCSFYVCSMLAL